MSTLDGMAAEIANDLDREDLGPEINAAINTAINYYQTKDFLFTESRERTWNTVANQLWYTSTDVPDIARLIRISKLWLSVGNTIYDLKRIRYDVLEQASQSTTAYGQPYEYTFYGQQIALYPVPNKVFEIRFQGDFIIPGPASGTEADNDWMNSAYEMIRSRAKYYLNAHTLRDDVEALKMKDMARDGLINLKTKAERLKEDGRILYSEF